MKIRNLVALCLSAGLFTACFFNDPDENNGNLPNDEPKFEDVSSSNLPLDNLSGNSMDAKPVDVDGDEDPDLIIAIEFGANKILINNGQGIFEDDSPRRLPTQDFDSEDVAAADFDSDFDADLFFASEDNLTNEFYLNSGSGFFSDLSNRIPVTGRSNAALASDIDQDGDPDILIGNNGQNVILINNGNAIFSDQSAARLPQRLDITQDLEPGDIDGDGDDDLIVANEDDNRILLNIGSGFFEDQTQTRLPLPGAIEETREADLGDIDGDSDLDLYFANVALFQANANPHDRLLVNDGQGVFTDVTEDQLPAIDSNTMDADFADLDEDGDLDILAGDFDGGIKVLLNDGSGTFTDETAEWIPSGINPNVVDFEIADFNGDQLVDVYICSYQGPDVLLFQNR